MTEKEITKIFKAYKKRYGERVHIYKSVPESMMIDGGSVYVKRFPFNGSPDNPVLHIEHRVGFYSSIMLTTADNMISLINKEFGLDLEVE